MSKHEYTSRPKCLADSMLDLKALPVELKDFTAAPGLTESFYLGMLARHCEQIATKGPHIGVATLEEVRLAIETAYKAGLAEQP